MAGTDHRQERLRRRAEHVLADSVGQGGGLSGWKRQVLVGILMESRHGWHTRLSRDLPETSRECPDAVVIGPKGVLAVLLREEPPAAEEVRTAARSVGELLLGARIREGNVSEAVVRPVVVLPHVRRVPPTADYLLLPATGLDRVLHRGDTRLDRRDARTLERQLHGDPRFVPCTPEEEHEQSTPSEELFGADEIRQDRFEQALSGSFESWLTFLDDSQFAMVRRRYAGPARISGPAGTGKSVVALHRMVHLAKRTTGRMLFTTYARNLPPIAANSFARLAPELRDRVEFRTLHSWALGLLHDRGVALDVDLSGARTCFSLAWSRFGKHSKLRELNTSDYWWEEIDRVIKGRGLRDRDEYQAVRRTGRGTRLERGTDRALVWELYEEYERIRRERGKSDFNDLLTSALNEVEATPPDPGYDAVVVDEVQDITLIGLRLLRALAGDGPNGLLLVGDGQQQIYAGGWRLSDAGIPIRGRGEVLRNNYRNASRVLELAKQFDATNQVDDLDGDVGVSLRDTVATLRGGYAVPWRGPRARHEEALISAMHELRNVPPDEIAVLTFDNQAVKHWSKVLRDGGIGFDDLDRFDGTRNRTVKVGTVHRAKGLEFRAVFVPELPARWGNGEQARERHERGQRARLVALTRARDHLWVGFPEDEDGPR